MFKDSVLEPAPVLSKYFKNMYLIKPFTLDLLDTYLAIKLYSAAAVLSLLIHSTTSIDLSLVTKALTLVTMVLLLISFKQAWSVNNRLIVRYFFALEEHRNIELPGVTSDTASTLGIKYSRNIRDKIIADPYQVSEETINDLINLLAKAGQKNSEEWEKLNLDLTFLEVID